jgi:hypothetical protein
VGGVVGTVWRMRLELATAIGTVTFRPPRAVT